MRARITPSNICYTGDPVLAGLTGKDGKKKHLTYLGPRGLIGYTIMYIHIIV